MAISVRLGGLWRFEFFDGRVRYAEYGKKRWLIRLLNRKGRADTSCLWIKKAVRFQERNYDNKMSALQHQIQGTG